MGTGQGGGDGRPESCLLCGVAWPRHAASAANSGQVLLTWRAVYSFIDPAFYAVASRIRKTDSICDLNAVRLGAGKLDEGTNCLCPPMPCTHLRVRAERVRMQATMTNVGEVVVRTGRRTRSVGLLVPGSSLPGSGAKEEVQASIIRRKRGVVPDTLTVPAAACRGLLLVSQLRCWSCWRY